MANNNSSIKCPECGGDNPESASFCSNCGVKLEPATPSNNCPSCGAKVAENAKFCGECGETLTPKPVNEEPIETTEESMLSEDVESIKTSESVPTGEEEAIETPEETMPTEDEEPIVKSEESPVTASEDIVEKSDENICPNCGHQNPPKTIFCKSCGKSLRKRKSPKSIPKQEIPLKQDVSSDRPTMAPKRKIPPKQEIVSEDSSTTSPTRKIPPMQGKSYKTMPNVAKERKLPPRSKSKPHKSSGLGGIFGNKSKLINEIDKTLGSIEEKAQPHIKKIDNKIQDIQDPKKTEDSGYLICESCNNQYKLKPGESPDDFAECSCGGKLRFSKTIN